MNKKLIFILLFAVTLISCSPQQNESLTSLDSTAYHEMYRPRFHFSPAKGWTNDPNGLVYYEGEYHIFYQYNPYGTTWGHMSWGHAVSKDLLHWEHLPVAISEYLDPATRDSTMIFSGTVVADNNNSSGLCEGKSCLIAIYTSHVSKNNQTVVQHQSLAYSNDKGRTWKRYDKNPILDIQRKDFRDPKVFWYEPKKTWIMALVIPDLYKIRFYQSVNLRDWIQLSEFGGMGDTSRIWECPDLYELPIENEPGKTKWVISLSGSHPQGPAFVGMQYFIGRFDGSSFVPDDPEQIPRYVDYGKDYYAGIVYNNLPKDDHRTIMIGWANNWTYANQIPTSTWRGAMAIPRELALRKTEDGIQLVQRPLSSIHTLRGRELIDLNDLTDKGIALEIEIDPADAKEAGVRILKNGEEKTVIGYMAARQEIFLDRTHAGVSDFNREFPGRESVPAKPVDGKIKLQVFIDRSIVEVFVNDGAQALCEQVFPIQKRSQIKSYSDNGKATIKIQAWEMNSVWR